MQYIWKRNKSWRVIRRLYRVTPRGGTHLASISRLGHNKYRVDFEFPVVHAPYHYEGALIEAKAIGLMIARMSAGG